MALGISLLVEVDARKVLQRWNTPPAEGNCGADHTMALA
jgi:hypothetical protein